MEYLPDWFLAACFHTFGIIDRARIEEADDKARARK